MKKQPRLFPVFVALCLFLASGPLPAAAQMRVQIGAPSSAGVPIVPVGSIMPSAGALSNSQTTLGLNAALSAPSMAPTPLVSAIAMAALQTPSALTVVMQQAAATPTNAIVVPTPGAAAAHIAQEAAAYAEAPSAKAPVAKAVAAPVQKGLAGRILDTLLRRPAASISFDGAAEKSAPIFARMGLKEQKPLSLPNGSAMDEQPTTPSPDRVPTTRVEAYGLVPGAVDVGGIFETSRKVLSADPANGTAVVDAIKAMIDADQARYGVSSADLRLIHAQKFTGKGEQADTLFVYFRQTKNGLVVNGSGFSFTVKTLDGRPTIVAQTGQVFPQIDVNTETVLTDDQIMSKIAERTGLPAQEAADSFKFYEQKIVYSRGAWHNVKLYVADGLPFMVAVDVVSGLVFAWDNRTGLESFNQVAAEPNAGGVSGKIAGNTVDRGPILANSVVSEVPMPFLEVKIGAKSYVTDKNGALPKDFETGTEGLELTATLSGPYVRVENQQGKTLSVKVTVKPGENKVVFNPSTGITDENTLAQINAFSKVNLSLNFLRERGLSNERIDKTQLPVRTNIDDECNAYYTPGSPSLNFFRSSKNCVNSAYDTVAEHENGHFWDDFTGGIVNGGLSEGWGDILSMFRLNNPIVGEHFLKVARGGVDYIRHGENKYQYNEFDEVHAQGQAWGGFAWKLRKALMAKLGDEEGAAMAESLVMPTMFAKAATIPNAMAQVLVNATKKDGTILHEAEIRAAAKAHGITLPAGPTATGFVAGLMNRFTAPLRKMSLAPADFVGGRSEDAARTLTAGQSSPNVRATMKFTAGALIRNRVANGIRQYLDETGLKYELKEYKSWLETDFLLAIEGPGDQVREHMDNIQRWMRSIMNSSFAPAQTPSASAAALAGSIVPSWFDASGLSVAFANKAEDGLLVAVLRRGRLELGVFLDEKGSGQAIFTKYALNPMGTPKKEEIVLQTEASRRSVADILRKTQSAEPVSGNEKAVLDAILALLEGPVAPARMNIAKTSPAGKIDPALEKVLEPRKRYDILVTLKSGLTTTEEDQAVYFVSQAGGSMQYDDEAGTIKVLGIQGRSVRALADMSGVKSISALSR